MINRLTAVSPSGIVRRYSHLGSTRRTLENSCLYSEEFGIDLTTGRDREHFYWFLASLLFGARIFETTAKNTY